MSDRWKTLTTAPDSDLALLARQAETDGRPIRLKAGENTYTLWVHRAEDDDAVENLWSGYDPERVRKALRETAGILTGVDTKELLADLREQRGQDTSGRPA